MHLGRIPDRCQVCGMGNTPTIYHVDHCITRKKISLLEDGYQKNVINDDFELCIQLSSERFFPNGWLRRNNLVLPPVKIIWSFRQEKLH